ncbi:MAG: endolytic transglycosylase MltG [Oscillospiraceae bacterium]|nr:endolytic transglycosylase MltG [Oscillospiraceae bacterium]
MKFKRIVCLLTILTLIFCAFACTRKPDIPVNGTTDSTDRYPTWLVDYGDTTEANSQNGETSRFPPSSAQSNTNPGYSSPQSSANPSYSVPPSSINPGYSASPTYAVTTTSASITAASSASTARETVRVTIRPGQNFFDVRSMLESAGVCSAAAFTETARTYQVNSFNVPDSADRVFKMEGYLFPDTYEFYKNDNPKDVLVKMLNNYRQKSGMPTAEQLIVASIAEKEARSYENMRLVASVLYNRVKDGTMPMQVEPARSYANALIADSGHAVGSPKAESIAILYGTMRPQSKGRLPAGPICNPGANAIKAAMNPAQSDYLYFFFGNDNENHYAATFEEHNALIDQYGVKFS